MLRNCPKCGLTWRKGVSAMTLEGKILTLCPNDGEVFAAQFWPPLFYSKEEILTQTQRAADLCLSGTQNGLVVAALMEIHDWVAYTARRQSWQETRYKPNR